MSAVERLEAMMAPVAWRYRYVHPGKVNHWIVRQSPIYPSAASPGLVAIEVEPLYAHPAVNSLPALLSCVKALEALTARTFEYVGEEPFQDGLECDDEMRALAVAGRSAIALLEESK